MAVPAYTISGKILVSPGNGLSGASVSVFSDSAFPTLATSTTTGDDGSYTTDLVPGGGATYYLKASLSGFAPMTAPVSVVVSHASVTGANLTLGSRRYEAEDATISGTGIGLGHDPGASGTAYNNVVGTGPGGTNTFTVPVTTPGRYTMTLGYYEIWGTRDTYVSANGTRVAGPLSCPNGPNAGIGSVTASVPLIAGANSIALYTVSGDSPHWDYIDISAVPVPQLVSGKVTTDSAGIRGATVYFNTDSPAYVNSLYTATTTNAAGNFFLILPAGSWRVAAGAPGYAYSADSALSVAGAPVPLADIVLTMNTPRPQLPAAALTLPGGVPTFNLSTVPWYRYRLRYTGSLAEPLSAWLPVLLATAANTNGWVLAANATMNPTDTNGQGQAQRFYRLEAANP